MFSVGKSLSGVLRKAGGKECDFTMFVTSFSEQPWELRVSLWKKALLGCGWYVLGLLCQCSCELSDADSDCSTLVVKQKLPGVYVQPSYRSALSKFKLNF